MGWCGIALPADVGGSGLGGVELAILCEQMGRVLLPSPFFATVALAAPAIALAATAAQREALLPGIAAGRTRATLAIANEHGAPGLDGIGPRLARSKRGWRLEGTAGFVIHADVADVLVVAARAAGSRGADGVSLVVVRPDDASVSIERLTMLDQTRPMSRVRFESVALAPGAILGEPGEAGPALATALARAQAALAAEQLGGAEAALEIATEHAKTRIQFDRPIGSFQAVKHRLADMMVATEAARSAAYYAACAVDELPAELEEAAAIAGCWCSETFTDCAGRHDPAPGWRGLYLGARRASLFQARAGIVDAAGVARVASRADRRASTPGDDGAVRLRLGFTPERGAVPQRKPPSG